MPLRLRAADACDPAELAALQADLEPLGLLHDMLGWAARQRPPARVIDVVIQDEFTHDVVVALGERWLVFDAT